MDIALKVRNLIEKDIENAGYKVSDVLYVKEGSTYFLRVVIEKDGTLTVDDCVEVSRIINPILDSNDPIEENYILDVCSKEEGCE